jgi:molybdopterin converting factor small subunit
LLGVKFAIPGHLQQFVDNHEIVEAEGKTVKESMLNLGVKYPAILPELFDINGEMAVIVLLEGVPIGDDTINTPVKEGDHIDVFPIIIGG